MPSFAKLVNEFQQKGVDEVACLAINDPYCMNGWAKAMGTSGISFYADADESFTRAVSETRDCTGDALGPGVRSNRYACVVEDGVVGACFVEAGPGDLTVSDGATLLEALIITRRRTGSSTPSNGSARVPLHVSRSQCTRRRLMQLQTR